MSMLNTSHLRGSVLSATGLIYNIDFARENKTYYPGEIVSGKILFSTATRDPLQGLKTRLVGIEEIFWGNSFIASSKVFLSQDCYAPHVPSADALDPESSEEWYDYEFKFTLPMTNIPQSFAGAYGSIRYYVETVLSPDRLGGYATSFEASEIQTGPMAELFRKSFTVKPIVDLNSVPDLQTPAFLLKDNSEGLTSFFRNQKHPIRFTLSISKRGFAPATEGIHFTIVVNNGSSKTISTTSLKLIQETKYSAGQISREDIKTVLKVMGPANLPSKTLKTWEDELTIPENLPISFASYSISIKYKLRVTLKTSGFPECVKGDLSIVLGTIPIDSLDQSTSLQPRSSSFTSSRDRLSPGLRRHRHRQRNSPVANLDLSYRHSISALPTYDHADRHSPSPRRTPEPEEESSLPPPSYTEATGSNENLE